MEQLVDDGVIRYIGVSNFTLFQLKEAEDALSKYEVTAIQPEYNLKVQHVSGAVWPTVKSLLTGGVPRFTEVDQLAYCEGHRIAILAYRPLGGGDLVHPRGSLKALMDDVALKYGRKTYAQIVLNWLLQQSRLVFPIPRASRPERILENAGAVGWQLTSEDCQRLEHAVTVTT